MSAFAPWLDRLVTGPLIWLPLTVAIYLVAAAIYRRTRQSPMLNPTLMGILVIGALLLATGTPHERYFEGAGFLHYLLGPTVVALAVPLYRHLPRIRGRSIAIGAALLVGSVVSITVGIAVASLLGAAADTQLSLSSKSATVAISMEVSRLVGGIPALTAALTIATGITGAVIGPYVLDVMRVRASEARGFALGVTSHGIATARAFHESEVAGSFASLGMGLNAVLTALLVPPILKLLGFLG
jgi:predicted murein hydrolase (TIGR00659 family)